MGSISPYHNQANNNAEDKKRLEILYDGYYYDITEFSEKHPGGDVILYYTGKGENATEAVQQFHGRFINKVHLIMKGFKKRLPTEQELLEKPTIERRRYENLTNDFAQLYRDAQKEGLFDPSAWHVFWRIAECIILLFISGIACRMQGIGWTAIACFCGALSAGKAGWVQHEAGHLSLTAKPKIDRLLQSIVFGIFTGVSGRWYTEKHSKHHAMPQRKDFDADTNTLPLIACNTLIVKGKDLSKSFMLRHQGWLFVPLDCFLISVGLKFVRSPLFMWMRRDYFEMFILLCHFAISYTVYPSIGMFLFTTWLGGIYLFGNIALSHTHLPLTENTMHWVEFALLHSCNVHPGWLVDWWMGYINFQIEHHLFPTMPHYNLRHVTDRVKGLAKKYDLPFHCLGYGEIWMATLKNLAKVSKHLES